MVSTNSEIPQTFTVIYLDPAWSFNNKHIGGSGKSGAVDKYPTMTVDEIAALPIAQLADPKECVLAMWITNAHLLEGAQVPILKAWGFTAKALITWYKKSNRFGLGYWYQNKTEHLIVAVKGAVKAFHCTEENIVDTELVEADLLGHSVKPARFRQLIEMSTRDLSEQRMLEINARERVDGWYSLGFAVTGKDMRAPDDIYEHILPPPPPNHPYPSASAVINNLS